LPAEVLFTLFLLIPANQSREEAIANIERYAAAF